MADYTLAILAPASRGDMMAERARGARMDSMTPEGRLNTAIEAAYKKHGFTFTKGERLKASLVIDAALVAIREAEAAVRAEERERHPAEYADPSVP